MYQDIMERVIIRGKGRKRSKKRKADGPFFPPTPNKPQGLTFWGGGRRRSFESAKNVIKGRKVMKEYILTLTLSIPLSAGSINQYPQSPPTSYPEEHYPSFNQAFIHAILTKKEKKFSSAPAFDSLQGGRVYKYTVWVFHQGQKALVFECFARYTETKGLIFPELYLDLADMFVCRYVCI